MTAPNLLLGLLLKLAIGGSLFIIIVSFGLWLGQVGFISQKESDAVSG